MTRVSQRLRLAVLAAGGLLSAAAPASAEAVYGGGSTAAFGLYREWFDTLTGATFASCNPGPSNCYAYAPVGSGAGITALINQQSPNAFPSDTPYENGSIIYNEGTTGYGTGPNFWDFSGSDMPLTAAQLAAYNTAAGAARGLPIQIPAAGSSVTIPVNTTGLNIVRPTPVGGSSGLYLSRRALCGIFTGTITNWNDPILTYDNNNIQLHANLQIRVVRRADSSGTTFLLTRHLDMVCAGQADGGNHTPPGSLADWAGGIGTTVIWPAGFIAATGSTGVASTVTGTVGAIGYVNPDFTRQVATPQVSPAPVVANLQNQAGWAARQVDPTPTPGEHVPVAPTLTTIGVTTNTFTGATTQTAAAWGSAVDTAALRNPAATMAYPVIGFSLLDLYTCYFPASETAAIKTLVAWYTGTSLVPDTIARNHGFTPLTATAKSRVWAWVNSATTGVRTGPIPPTCTISSGS